MRRNEKEILDPDELDSILREARVCRLGLSGDGYPYVVPMCFGYTGNVIYLHCATQGKKIDMIRANPKVCVEFDTRVEVKPADKPCSWSISFKSIIGTGNAVIVEDAEEKTRGLAAVMAQYSDGTYDFPGSAVEKTLVIRVDILEMTGKKSGL